MVSVALMVSLALTAKSAAIEPSFEIENLKVDGNLTGLDAVDLDGDGKLDLLAVVARGKGQTTVRELAVFWNAGGSFTAKPDLVLAVDDDLCAFDFAPLGGARASSLIGIAPTGLRVRDFVGRQPSPWRTVVSQATLFLRPSREKLPRVRVAQRGSAAAAPSLFVPTLSALTVFTATPGLETFTKTAEVPLEIEMTLNESSRVNTNAAAGLGHLGMRLVAPTIELADIDADGRTDLFVLQKDLLKVFKQGDDGRFAQSAAFEHAFKVFTDAEEKEGKAHDLHVQFADVDGDGRADAVVSKTISAGITSSTTTVYLFRASATGYADTPDQTLISDGASIAELVLQDITGDGHPDLIIPSVKIGVFAIIRMLTSHKANVGFLLHPFVPAQKKFALKPTADRTLVFDLDLAGKTDDLQAIDMTGDFDADGQKDLVFGVADQSLAIFRGAKQRDHLFEDEALAQINVRAFGSALPVDLDGHGRSDVVLWYAGTPEHKNEIAVIHNRVK